MYAFMQVCAVNIIRGYIKINDCVSQDQLVQVGMWQELLVRLYDN